MIGRVDESVTDTTYEWVIEWQKMKEGTCMQSRGDDTPGVGSGAYPNESITTGERQPSPSNHYR